MKRRQFIQTCGMCCTVIGLSACSSLLRIDAGMSDGVIKVNRADFNGKDQFIVKNPKLPAPLFIKRASDGTYQALLMLCTHKRCGLSLQGPVLYCGCHGSEFDLSGKVLEGPATRDLVSYPTSSDQDYLYIHV